MTTENYIRIIAGSIVLITSLLGFFYHEYWLFITMFVGANLLQFGFTGFCPMELILKKLGIKCSNCKNS